jgi:type VI secretion system ImpM family protein
MEAAFGQTGALGKLPSRGDFIQLGAGGGPFASFDAFLTESIEWAEGRTDASWAEAFALAPLQAFVFRAPARGGSTLLAGAMAPSHDQAGRRFPLSVAAPFTAGPRLLAAPELLPLVLESCWYATSGLVTEARGSSGIELSTRLPVLSDASAEEVEEARESYAHWAETLPVDELWALLFAQQPALDPALVLAFLYQAVRPCRGQERPTTPLSLRVPLGLAGGAAVCFWLDFVRRVARWRATVPSFFWSHDGESGVLFLCLGEPPKSALAELWQPTGRRDEVCDLAQWIGARDATALQAAAETREAWAAASRVADLLRIAETLDA